MGKWRIETKVARIAAFIALGVLILIPSTVTAKNTAYLNPLSPPGTPEIGNWAWVTRNKSGNAGVKEHIWWMKHHWIDAQNHFDLKNGAETEMEFYNGGLETNCDVFNITGVFLNAPGFRTFRPIDGCGNKSVKELVRVEVQNRSLVPLTPPTNNVGPSWAAVAVIGPESPSTTEVNMEWEENLGIIGRHKGKIYLQRCSFPSVPMYIVTNDDPTDIT